MRLRHLSILFAAMALSACGGAQDAAPSTEAEASQQTPAADIAVEGPERRILAFGDSLFAGYGLEENEGYPEQLEDALRKDGINAATAAFSSATLAQTPRIRSTSLKRGVCVQPSTGWTVHTAHTAPPPPLVPSKERCAGLTLHTRHTSLCSFARSSVLRLVQPAFSPRRARHMDGLLKSSVRQLRWVGRCVCA